VNILDDSKKDEHDAFGKVRFKKLSDFYYGHLQNNDLCLLTAANLAMTKSITEVQ
jgi:hypothetical protein